MMFESENKFKSYFEKLLKQVGMSMIKIESHSTQVGIPDAFVQGHGYDCWIEFKNGSVLKYRPGQETWHHDYLKAHNGEQCVLTVHAKNFIYIRSSNCNDTLLLDEQHHELLSGILKFMSHDPRAQDVTVREYFVSRIEDCFPGHDFDFDIDVIAEDLEIYIDGPCDYKAWTNIKTKMFAAFLMQVTCQL